MGGESTKVIIGNICKASSNSNNTNKTYNNHSGSNKNTTSNHILLPRSRGVTQRYVESEGGSCKNDGSQIDVFKTVMNPQKKIDSKDLDSGMHSLLRIGIFTGLSMVWSEQDKKHPVLP